MATEEFCPCGNAIETMAFKGTGVCSMNCQKKYIGNPVLSTMLSVELKRKIAELRSPEKATENKNFMRGLNHGLAEIEKLIK